MLIYLIEDFNQQLTQLMGSIIVFERQVIKNKIINDYNQSESDFPIAAMLNLYFFLIIILFCIRLQSDFNCRLLQPMIIQLLFLRASNIAYLKRPY